MKNSSCLNTSIAIMKYTGVWIPDNLRNRWLYILFAIFVQTIFFIFTVVTEIAYLFTVIGDTERIVEAGVLLLSHLVQGVKILNIYVRQDRIKRLINFIDGPDFYKSDPSKTAILEEMVYLTKVVGQTIIASASMTALFWTLVPVLKSELSLPLKTAYPFDINWYPMFAIIYAYSAVSVTVVGVNDAAVNYIVSGLMVLAAAHLDVLNAELSEIDAGGKRKNYQETVRSIKYHQNIIEYVRELERIFQLPIFCQFMTTSAIVCMTLYKITITAEPVELMTMIFYLICVFMELLMYCYPGDLIINKAIKSRDSLIEIAQTLASTSSTPDTSIEPSTIKKPDIKDNILDIMSSMSDQEHIMEINTDEQPVNVNQLLLPSITEKPGAAGNITMPSMSGQGHVDIESDVEVPASSGRLLVNVNQPIVSLQVAEAATPATWSGDLRCQRALLLCCARAQRMLCVNAGAVFRASLPTAAAVTRAAYSYYTVLQQKMGN